MSRVARALRGLRALLAGCAVLASAGVQAQTTARFAFVHVNVVPMDTHRVLNDTTVLVEDGLITAVGEGVVIPPGTRILDGQGRAYLAPGLADMHVHSTARGDLALYLAHGVTTVLNMGSASSEFMGQVMPAVNAGRQPGPHIHAALRVNGSGRYGHLVVTTPDEARAVVGLARTNGYQFIKVYNDLAPPVFEALSAEGRAQGVPVVGHSVTAVGLERQMAAGQVLIAHLEEFLYTLFPEQQRVDDAPPLETIPSVVAGIRRAGVFVTADLFTYQTIAEQWGRPEVVRRHLARAEAQLLAPSQRLEWPGEGYDRRAGKLEARRRFLARLAKALQDAGVPLVAGTDAPSIPGVFPGASLHDDLDALRAAGFSNFDALATATRTPGQFIARTLGAQAFGTVTAGFRADLVLTSANPVEDPAALRQPLGVMAAGHWYSREELQRLVRGVKEGYRRATAQVQPPSLE